MFTEIKCIANYGTFKSVKDIQLKKKYNNICPKWFWKNNIFIDFPIFDGK